MRRLFVDPKAPQRDALQEAANRIRAGGVVAIPTDTLYGLAATPFQADAVARIFAVKGRAAERALPLIAEDAQQVLTHLGRWPASADRLIERFWPGPLTLLVAAPPSVARGVQGGTGRVGVRVPADNVARAICRATGWPIIATSANRSGEAATSEPDEVEERLGDRIDLLIDVGRTPGGLPSTIVDVVDATPRLVRAGAIPWDEIRACLDRA